MNRGTGLPTGLSDASNVGITGGTIDSSTLRGGGIPIILAKSGAAVSAPNDTTEDTLATITVPANAMGANGVLRITTQWTMTSSANTKQLRVRYSGGAGATYFSQGLGASTSAFAQTTIANLNATNSQSGATVGIHSGATVLGVSGTTSAADTTAVTTIVITGQKTLGTETLTLVSYLVELFANGA